MKRYSAERRESKWRTLHWFIELIRASLTTVVKSGSNHVAQMYNLLSNVWNQSRGGGLAEPFPWTVNQGVILVFIIIDSQL